MESVDLEERARVDDGDLVLFAAASGGVHDLVVELRLAFGPESEGVGVVADVLVELRVDGVGEPEEESAAGLLDFGDEGVEVVGELSESEGEGVGVGGLAL